MAEGEEANAERTWEGGRVELVYRYPVLAVGCQLLEFGKELPECPWLQIQHDCPSPEFLAFQKGWHKSLPYRFHVGLQQNISHAGEWKFLASNEWGG